MSVYISHESYPPLLYGICCDAGDWRKGTWRWSGWWGLLPATARLRGKQEVPGNRILLLGEGAVAGEWRKPFDDVFDTISF